MAIAVDGGHVSRAIDFYNNPSKYFIIGGTKPWADETTPDTPNVKDFRLRDVIGLKKATNVQLVVPDENGTIQYRTQNWRIVLPEITTRISSVGVTKNSTVISVTSTEGLKAGAKLRVNNLYEGKIVSISGSLITLDTEAPEAIPAGALVLGGAFVEGAKYVYVETYLEYDRFPIEPTYRQIGLCTGVTPNDSDTLLAAAYSPTGTDQFTSLGVLEVLDNRLPASRDINQREQLSLILEF